MSGRDLLNMPFLAEKLRKLQGGLAAGVKPGSAPHPKRVLKEAARANHGQETSEPSHPRRRKRKDKAPTRRRGETKASSSRGVVDAAGGETDAERAVYSGEEEVSDPLEQAIERAKKEVKQHAE